MALKQWKFQNGSLTLGKNSVIMGILNVTPDSFSDGGSFFAPETAIAHAREMRKDGAAIIDIGAMSTRPGSEPVPPVPPEEEIRRLTPVLNELANDDNMILSVDTVNPETAAFALEAGAHIINDVSGYFHRDMAAVVKEYGAGWIVTHTGNVPAGTVLEYPDGVVASVNRFFDEMLDECHSFGIAQEYLCLDPGFGFAKTVEDNVDLLKNLEKVIRPDVAFLTGLSRKRFVGALTNVAEASDRLIGTITADLIALQKGSDMIRVHDVKEAVQSVALWESVVREELF